MTAKAVPVAYSNMSDLEVVRHIRGHFPQLQGALKDAIDRYERLAVQVADSPTTGECPECGTSYDDEG